MTRGAGPPGPPGKGWAAKLVVARLTSWKNEIVTGTGFSGYGEAPPADPAAPPGAARWWWVLLYSSDQRGHWAP